MPVYCEDDMAALCRYSMLSQKRPNRDKMLTETKSVSHTRQTVPDRPKNEIRNAAKGQRTHKNEGRTVKLKDPEPLVHRQIGNPRLSRNEILAKPKTTNKAEIIPEAANNEATLRRILTSSSVALKKKASTSSSTTSNGDGTMTAHRKVKSPALHFSKKTLYPSESVTGNWRMNLPIGSGFINMGNTCYLNSTLQALFHIPRFMYWLLVYDTHARQCEGVHSQNSCLICPVTKTLLASHKHSGNAIRPTEVYSRLSLICKHLRRGSQEDAHEFLRYLLEGMEKSYLDCYNNELNKMAKETTPIGQLFGGYIRTEVACLECGHISTTFQHFQDLILDIQSASSVDEALDQYFATESLGDEYKCDKCKRRIAATKKFFLEKPPKVLCVQLKRFDTLGGKNNKHISLKEWVDLEPYLHQSCKGYQNLQYHLVSMILHHGHSTSCGHYTAVGLTSAGGYYLFDDSAVSPMHHNEVLETNPYILMFQLSLTSITPTPSTSVPVEHSRNVTRNRRH